MEKYSRPTDSFCLQICSRDSVGTDAGNNPFNFCHRMTLPSYMTALEADMWEVSLLCIQSTGNFPELSVADRSFYLLDNKGQQHQVELPLTTFKDNNSLKNAFTGELHAFFRGKVSNESSTVFTAPSCNFVDGCMRVAYNGCGYRLEETNN